MPSVIRRHVSNLLWVRAESKVFEQRTAVTPEVAGLLIQQGYSVIVEQSPVRAFDDDEYQQVGCTLAEAGSWRQAPANAVIIGLKELPVESGPFIHQHVHFAHVFKQQRGWQQMLQQFRDGGGLLLDLEYLTDEQGRRCAAFGYWAGYVGAALAVLAYSHAARGRVLGSLTGWSHSQALLDELQVALQDVELRPDALVMGALGRSGRGAMALLEECGLSATAWDQNETQSGGPFDAILQHELLINCVFVDRPLPPFTTLEHLNTAHRRLQVIADVSCDPYGTHNSLPLYAQCTSMDVPVITLPVNVQSGPALQLIAIDHLPSLLPRESSEDFSRQLLPCLSTLKDSDAPVWQRALSVYKQFSMVV